MGCRRISEIGSHFGHCTMRMSLSLHLPRQDHRNFWVALGADSVDFPRKGSDPPPFVEKDEGRSWPGFAPMP
jgi:hypothetical protein